MCDGPFSCGSSVFVVGHFLMPSLLFSNCISPCHFVWCLLQISTFCSSLECCRLILPIRHVFMTSNNESTFLALQIMLYHDLLSTAFTFFWSPSGFVPKRRCVLSWNLSTDRVVWLKISGTIISHAPDSVAFLRFLLSKYVAQDFTLEITPSSHSTSSFLPTWSPFARIPYVPHRTVAPQSAVTLHVSCLSLITLNGTILLFLWFSGFLALFVWRSGPEVLSSGCNRIVCLCNQTE